MSRSDLHPHLWPELDALSPAFARAIAEAGPARVISLDPVPA